MGKLELAKAGRNCGGKRKRASAERETVLPGISGTRRKCKGFLKKMAALTTTEFWICDECGYLYFDHQTWGLENCCFCDRFFIKNYIYVGGFELVKITGCGILE